ncbi:glycosyltransferase family 21 protein [Stenotrophomonas sp.]|uniref:glycosyltransferase family 21 protein n=1 Tax=Stenotrophomonas sp. TaxID=69392 RepID=UPI002D367988|nr:glycosyltransferase [Stenotrophomonas sp.]HYQ24688.1 glycosyltransferase [Stenotrophomonas sp.]
MGSLSLDAVALASLGLAVLYLLLVGVKAAGALRILGQRPPRQQAADACDGRGVAILQPILGGDPLLAQVLRHNLQALPGAHFHWLLDEADGTGRAAADALCAAHPGHQITCLVYPGAPEGTNPKTFKLDAVLAQVREPMLLVLDDDARLSAAALAQLVDELETTGADLVTALPCYRDDGAPGARLMAQFVNNNAVLTYLGLLPWLPPLSINGMCYALRSERLRALGGFSPLLRMLADDLALARALRRQGARLFQSTAPVEVQTHVPTLQRYRQQMHRWMLFAVLLLRDESPRLRLLIGVLHGLPPLLLWALLVLAVLPPIGLPAVAAVLVLLLRTGLLRHLQHRATGEMRHRALASLLAELLQPLHLLHALCLRRIRWRTRLYQVRANDDFRGG